VLKAQLVVLPFPTHRFLVESKALVESRLGQGRFRQDLLSLWSRQCAVTGLGVAELLRASHIKPWRSSDNVERLDQYNGVLLAPHTVLRSMPA
jgi:HNH endonuclease